MNNSNGNNNMMEKAKTGRKGDPRMHRSVAARLANPELSLFDALRIGGFEYATDEDASVIDSEKVTLAQRKNQLSRRLRFARKQQSETGGGAGGDPGGEGGGANGGSGAAAGLAGGANGIGGPLANMGAAGAASNAPAGMSSEAQKQLEKLMQHSQQAKINSGVKRQNAEIDDEDDQNNQARARVAKFHPQYQPLFIPRAASASLQNNTAAAAAVLGNHPVGAAGAAAGAESLTGTIGGPAALTAQLAQTGQLPQLPTQLTQLTNLGAPGMPNAALMNQNQQAAAAANFSVAGASSPFFSQTAAAGLMSQPAAARQNIPSGVAIRSLTATAQSVGLTLEQLAVTLTSSSNLAKVLSDTDADQKQELALRLYQNEARALYQRCMLLAGFQPDEADENSQVHLEFALNAWQVEGKRLQDMVGNAEGECMDAPDVANTGEPQDQQELVQQQQQQQQQQEQQQLQEQFEQQQQQH